MHSEHDPAANSGHGGEIADQAWTPHQAEVRHWNEVDRQKSGSARLFWTDHPRIDMLYRCKATIGGVPWRKWMINNFGGPARTCLELGCGNGKLLKELLAEGVIERGVGVDLDVSRFSWDETWRGRIEFRSADINKIVLEPDSYDLIICQESLHHIEALEHVLQQVSRALTPRGLFVLDEFVGPARFQWTDEQLAATRQLLGLMPVNLRIYFNGVEKREEGRSTPEDVIGVCPSEAIRSDEIVPLVRRYFDVVTERPMGGTIAHLLYSGIIQNFPDDDETTNRMIDSIDRIETTLIESGALPSDFIFMVGRRREPAARVGFRSRVAHTAAVPATADRAGEVSEERMLASDLAAWLSEAVTENHCAILEACETGAPLLTGLAGRTDRFQLRISHSTRDGAAALRRKLREGGAEIPVECDDLCADAGAAYDLVFSAALGLQGSFDDQLRHLQGMASRSRKYVAVISPNPGCGWYWASLQRHEPFLALPCGVGREPVLVEELFRAAGIRIAGEKFLSREFSECVLRVMVGRGASGWSDLQLSLAPGLVPESGAAYFRAVLGIIDAEDGPAGVREAAIGLEDELEQMRGQAQALNQVLLDGLDEVRNARPGQSGWDDSSRRRLLHVQMEFARLQARIHSASRRLAGTPGIENLIRQQASLAGAPAIPNRRAVLVEQGKPQALPPDVAQVGRAVRLYRNQFNASLWALRSQRAWRMMVGIRKAYALWARGGMRDRLGALLAVKDALLMREVEAVYQPALPDIAQFVPASLLEHQPELTAAATREALLSKVRLPLQTLPDIVILAIIDFDFRFQRPQQLAAEYAARGHRVFWVSPTRFLRPGAEEPYHARELRPNLFEVQLRGQNVDLYIRPLPDEFRADCLVSLQHMYRDYSVSENLIMVQLPFYRTLALDMRREFGGVIVYDCMDDWDSFENMGSYNREQEQLLVHEADVLIVTARKLQEKFEARGLQPVLVRNGVDYDYFQRTPKVGKLGGLKKPVVGYYGAIADWIDLDLVLKAARARPQYSFVLIGQVFNRDMSELQKLPNVRVTGGVPYEDIPSYLAGFDVCHIPFLLNEVTAATDPVKLYEYLSLGKPVVATAMEELKLFPGVVYLARDADDYVAKLDQAIQEDCDALRQHRMEFAQSNTWKCRVDGIETAANRAFPKISIVIVTYNSASYIGPCLDSIWKHTSYPNYEVIVVDNASADETRVILREAQARNSRLRCLFLEENTGFAGGNNAGCAESEGEFLVLLNADTLVTPGWLGRMRAHFLKDEGIGIVCPTTNFAGNEVKISVPYTDQETMEIFAAWLGSAVRGSRTAIRMVPLFCGMMRTETYRKVGGLDERFGIGMFEDDDFSTAVQRLGLATVCAEDCFVHHFGQGSFAKLNTVEYTRLFERNQRLFEDKWETQWRPHRLRPGVRSPLDEDRFEPKGFCTKRER